MRVGSKMKNKAFYIGSLAVIFSVLTMSCRKEEITTESVIDQNNFAIEEEYKTDERSADISAYSTFRYISLPSGSISFFRNLNNEIIVETTEDFNKGMYRSNSQIDVYLSKSELAIGDAIRIDGLPDIGTGRTKITETVNFNAYKYVILFDLVNGLSLATGELVVQVSNNSNIFW